MWPCHLRLQASLCLVSVRFNPTGESAILSGSSLVKELLSCRLRAPSFDLWAGKGPQVQRKMATWQVPNFGWTFFLKNIVVIDKARPKYNLPYFFKVDKFDNNIFVDCRTSKLRVYDLGKFFYRLFIPVNKFLSLSTGYLSTCEWADGSMSADFSHPSPRPCLSVWFAQSF